MDYQKLFLQRWKELENEIELEKEDGETSFLEKDIFFKFFTSPELLVGYYVWRESGNLEYPVTKETLEKINSYADAIGYPVTRESLKNPKVRDTDILFKESLEELKARDLLTDATGRPDNAENPENSSYKSQLYKPLKVIKLYII